MTLERKTVLEDLKIEKNGISISEVPFLGKLNLRGNQKDKEFLSDAGKILETLLKIKNTNNKYNKVLLIGDQCFR